MLVFCPEVFELQRFRRPFQELQYVEASIYNMTTNGQEALPGDRNKPLVLATFGTQTIKYPHLDAQLDLIYQVARRLTGFDFVVATGSADSRQNTSGDRPPSNLFVRNSIPQQAWMKHASVFIGHGGLGGIKEAILEAVPQILQHAARGELKLETKRVPLSEVESAWNAKSDDRVVFVP